MHWGNKIFMQKLLEEIEDYRKAKQYKQKADKDSICGKYIIKNLANNKGFMAFLNEEYDEESDKEVCKKLGQCHYKERYYYFEELSNNSGGNVIFFLFNPSKTCPEKRDDTVNNCYKLAEKNKYKSMEVINVYSTRNPVVNKTFLTKEFNNEANKNFIKSFLEARKNNDIVIAWGYGKEKDYKNLLNEYTNIIKENGLKKYYISLNLIDNVIQNLKNKKMHPGNQVWSPFGGFEKIAILKEENDS